MHVYQIIVRLIDSGSLFYVKYYLAEEYDIEKVTKIIHDIMELGGNEKMEIKYFGKLSKLTFRIPDEFLLK